MGLVGNDSCNLIEGCSVVRKGITPKGTSTKGNKGTGVRLVHWLDN